MHVNNVAQVLWEPSGLKAPTAAPPAKTSAATATISAGGHLFQRMHKLSEADPSTFKKVAGQIATTFRNAASRSADTEAQIMSDLATSFHDASQSGSLRSPDTSALVKGNSPDGEADGRPPLSRLSYPPGAAPTTDSPTVQQALQDATNILDGALQPNAGADASAGGQ